MKQQQSAEPQQDSLAGHDTIVRRHILARQGNLVRHGMVLILLMGALLRLLALPHLPVGLHYDEAANLILTRQIAAGDRYPLFIRAYTGKEPLFFYLAAPWVRMTGGSPWGLRLGASMVGLLTIAATFAAVRALLASRSGAVQIALLSAAWMAFAFPHVLLSRYGFRAISQPLLQALTLAALWRGLRFGKLRWLIPAGCLLGLTGYTYLAARLFPIPLVVGLGWFLLRGASETRREGLGRVAVVLVVAATVFAPLGLFFIRNPDAFMTRITQVAAPTWREALRGIELCLRALFMPGDGDPYIRFNDPGRPVLGLPAAILALVGLVGLVAAPRTDGLEGGGRLVIVAGIAVMIFPSALATGEITPSNLRTVGLYPFLAVLPAWGLHSALQRLAAPGLRRVLLVVLFLAACLQTALVYVDWAGSDALFRAADGEMVLAAQVLDAEVSSGAPSKVYIASRHYRHPTVAALAVHYKEAKWLTGGTTLVLPAEGGAVYLIPESMAPPAPWPDAIVQAWTSASVPESLNASLVVHRLSADAVAALRAGALERGFGLAPGSQAELAEPADFAHVVLAHDAYPLLPCEVGAPCPVLVLMEAQAPYPSLQPVLRLFHPQSGEWTRTMAFHYASEQWEPGELILDQLVLSPRVGTPPGDGYRLGVGFFDPTQDRALPKLQAERFAGLETRFPRASGGFSLSPMPRRPTPDEVQAACPGVPKDAPLDLGALSLLGWTTTPEGPLRQGGEVELRLCWYALEAAPPYSGLDLRLVGASSLYSGPPAGGYPFASWREGEVVEDVYILRLPRTLSPGRYDLLLELDGADAVVLETLDVQSVTRTFTVPELTHQVNQEFADAASEIKVRLLGYDVVADSETSWSVTLYWQAVAEMDEDYVVFLHLEKSEGGTLVAQVDEMPREGTYPTSLWMQGEVISDVHTMTLPQDLRVASSGYRLCVGLYLPVSGDHLMADGQPRLCLEGVAP